MKWFKFVSSILILFMVIFITSCQDDMLPEQAQVTQDLPAELVTEYDYLLAEYAQHFVQILHNKSVRKHIKQEVYKRFDGDYNLLANKLNEQSISGREFKEQVFSTFPIEKYVEILNSNPKLNIAIPVHIDKWNAESEVPLVAILPSTYDDMESTHIPAFDADGNQRWIDAFNEPNFPVIVIGINERLITRDQIKEEFGTYKINDILNSLEPVYSFNGIDYFLKQNLISDIKGKIAPDPDDGGGGGGGDSGTGGSTSDCSRTATKYEYMKGIYMTSDGLNNYEGWPAGAPEFDIRFFAPDNSVNFSALGSIRGIFDLEPSSRSDIKDKWWDFTGSIVYWDTTLYTRTLLISMVEDDDQISVQLEEITVGGIFKISDKLTTNLSTKFKIKTVDEDMGHMTINYCPNPPVSKGGRLAYDISPTYAYFSLIQ